MVDIDPRPPDPGPDSDPVVLEPDDDAVAHRPKRRPVLVVAIVVAVLAAFLIVVFATSRSGGGDTADTPLLGEPAPAVGGNLLGGGGSFDLGARRGSWVVLNFFASWCDPCRQEAPELARFAAAQEAKGTDGAELVGVVYNDDEDAIADFLARYGGGNYPVVVGSDSAIDFGVVKIPETWIIDPNGVVQARIISTVSAEILEQLLQEAQGAQP